ncbi:MAG: hypothetical protein IPK17_20525 [Chloroflexi bacterium]|uniref:hypothetical protein n=1 Tax=Candidatus Flexifilum breve TaxID=3140694 RepID=UPI00313627A1|nr:hypothetical protein [Chloroflexota bacterium]
MNNLLRFSLMVVLLTLVSLPAHAQTDFVGVVRVESAFARALPAFDAEPLASVFDDERLEIISRNLDGSWFEVRRPGRFNTLGWVFEGIMDWDFQPELLPLGDFTTGVVGPYPLTQSTDDAIYVNEGAYLREQPLRRARMIMELPALITIPVLGRNQDGSWVFVNYLGQQGWMIAFAGRPIPNWLHIPMPPNLPLLETPPVVTIPVELQQAQIDRLRAFIHERYALAAGSRRSGGVCFAGRLCRVPRRRKSSTTPTVKPMCANCRVRTLCAGGRQAVAYLNRAREPLLHCGIVGPEVTIDARNAAINARVVFDATLERLQILEDEVVQVRR